MQNEKPFSLESRGIRVQFAIGLALLFAIPVLSIWYMTQAGLLENPGQNAGWTLVFGVMVLVLAAAGFLLLQRGPTQIELLRNRLERVVDTELAGRAAVAVQPVENDIEAINACMRAIVGELKLRLDTVDEERGKIQQQLLQAYKIEGLGTMAAGVAHDFNNFMAAVLGNASLVLNSLPPDLPTRDNALQIQATAQQAVDLAAKLALFSGHSRFHGAPVNLTALVREQAEALTGMVFRGVRVEYCLDENVPVVQADRNQVIQMLRCLLENGAESILSRHGKVTVTTGVVECDMDCLKRLEFHEKLPEGRYVYLEVSDTGSGIAEDVRHRMFDPFFSTTIRGQGMGLSIALGVVRSHMGGMQVRTSPEEGSAFRALFPCPETLRRV